MIDTEPCEVCGTPGKPMNGPDGRGAGWFEERWIRRNDPDGFRYWARHTLDRCRSARQKD